MRWIKKPAGFVNPLGELKLFIGAVTGVPRGLVSGPPLKDRSSVKSASPWLALSESSPTIE